MRCRAAAAMDRLSAAVAIRPQEGCLARRRSLSLIAVEPGTLAGRGLACVYTDE